MNKQEIFIINRAFLLAQQGRKNRSTSPAAKRWIELAQRKMSTSENKGALRTLKRLEGLL